METKDPWLPGCRQEGEGCIGRAQRFSGRWNYSICDHSDGYVSLPISPNPQNVTQPGVTPDVNAGV